MVLTAREALRGEGKFDTAGGVTLVAGHALQAAVVVQVAGAGRAHTVQLSMGELRAFHVHFNLLLVRVGAVRAERGTYAVHAYPLPLPWAALGCSTAASPQQLQLALEVPLLALQRLQLVLALPVRIFKFLYVCFGFVEQAQGGVAVAVWSQGYEGLQPLQTQPQVSSSILLELIMCGPIVVTAEFLISEFSLPLVVCVLIRRKSRSISVFTLSFSPF